MEEELDEIRNRMEETRASLVDKLDALEDRLKGTVEGATDSVSDTVNSVKSTVEKVKEALDVTRYVERHPWLTMGCALATGYLLGSLLGSRRREEAPPPAADSDLPAAPAPRPNGRHKGNGARKGSARAERRPPPARAEESLLREAVEKLSGLAVGSLMSVMRQVVTRVVPDAYVPDATRLVDRLTTKLGGKPLPASPEAEATYSHPRSGGFGHHG